MRFLADMPISPRTVSYLNRIGHEAVRLNELGMEKSEDEEIIAYGRSQNMVILTMDLDFGGILAFSGATKPSVMTFRLENPDVDRINRILEEIIPRLQNDLEGGAMVTVEEARVRIRKLPIR